MKDPFLALAPMAGYTDSAFRQICKNFGVEWLFTEMISSDGIAACKDKDSRLFEEAEFTEKERPISIQLVGNDPEKMAQAAEIVIDRFDPDGIDINMGCPARKVFKNDRGCALLKNPDLAQKIVEVVKNSASTSGRELKLSVKTRLGIEKESELEGFVEIILDTGIDFLTVHARTYKDYFSGPPRLEALARLAGIMKGSGCSLIGNGGVVDTATAQEMLDTGVDGLAIARGAVGNPWVFKSIKEGKDYAPSLEERIEVAEKHAEIAWENQKRRGIIEMRKHLGSYFKGLHGIKKYRVKLVKVETLEDVKSILSTLKKTAQKF